MKILKRILLVGWLILIFCLSAQPANDSTVTSNFVGELIYKLYSLIVSKDNTIDIALFLQKYISVIRKLAHFTEFAILGILFYINFDLFHTNKRLILSIMFSVIYAISDEIHQLFVVNRHCSVNDIFIDSIGAISGILLFHLIEDLWKKRSVSY